MIFKGSNASAGKKEEVQVCVCAGRSFSTSGFALIVGNPIFLSRERQSRHPSMPTEVDLFHDPRGEKSRRMERGSLVP